MSETEFSRIVDRRSITGAPLELRATDAERAALARRFGVTAIHRLEASVTLTADGENVTASGTLWADLTQDCAVSGDDLETQLCEEIALVFVPESDWADSEAEEVELEEGDLDRLPYDGTAFDLGEAIAQELGLGIDPYATGPGADATRAEKGLMEEGKAGALAEALMGLKKD
ncbi:YceD family protein [Aurantiacibacter spongiae]|uniref:DUF177 domain-containing protein n=1 Tax=Aurantiacibacter spongiae TaxID=2488860 RepID=A0A3N5DH53_9SPHN|nr:YceD family protein [Aurantiacibacter spongiae]RPF71002.1 DUF177 domain-containing protein [Aurantiacibacter spongiae]